VRGDREPDAKANERKRLSGRGRHTWLQSEHDGAAKRDRKHYETGSVPTGAENQR